MTRVWRDIDTVAAQLKTTHTRGCITVSIIYNIAYVFIFLVDRV